MKTLADLPLELKRVLVRVDLNVPMQDGKVTDLLRVDRILPTIRALIDRKAKTILLAHFGRPDGKANLKYSLAPIADVLSERLAHPVTFAADCIGPVAKDAIAALAPGAVLLLENVRFHAGEEKNASEFIAALAELGDYYINDAFSCAHRAHASTEGLAHHLPSAAGLNMQAELEALDRALSRPQRPLAAVVGGAKVSTKLAVLGHLVEKVDHLVIGGGMANTFLFALGRDVGQSLCERDMADTARTILEKAKAVNCRVWLPEDVRVADRFAAHAPYQDLGIAAVPSDRMILDIGPKSTAALGAMLEQCKTLVWNGPLGAFELPPFDTATVALAKKAALLSKAGRLLSVAGGGDTVAALSHAGVADDFSYVSTAGGAFLEWLEGKVLPGVAALAAIP